jgi:uncharacterized glyoxalase superfamily protein PhnB
MPSKELAGALIRSEAILVARDVAATIRFYRDVLGFTKEWVWDDPATHGGVSWDHAHLMFHLDRELANHMDGHQHYFYVKKEDDLHARHQQNGVQIISPLERKPWGMREYTIRDPNGYHLRFGEND